MICAKDTAAHQPYALTDPGGHVIRAPRRAAKVPRWRIPESHRWQVFVTSRGEQGVQQNWKGVASYATVGLEFGLSMLVGLFAGRWLDQKLDTAHWLTFIGGGFGVAAGYRRHLPRRQGGQPRSGTRRGRGPRPQAAIPDDHSNDEALMGATASRRSPFVRARRTCAPDGAFCPGPCFVIGVPRRLGTACGGVGRARRAARRLNLLLMRRIVGALAGTGGGSAAWALPYRSARGVGGRRLCAGRAPIAQPVPLAIGFALLPSHWRILPRAVVCPRDALSSSPARPGQHLK